MSEERLSGVIARIDAANGQDPNTIEINGEKVAAELAYGRRMTEAQEDLYPDASEHLKIAVRAQHIQRFAVPRDSYPMNRAGYHRWRNDLKIRHGEITAEIMMAEGYSDDDIERVKALIAKQNLKRDPEAQALEDVACIVFLRHYADAFAAKHDEAKMVRILVKTWAKMSEAGHAHALKLKLSPELERLVGKALNPGGGT